LALACLEHLICSLPPTPYPEFQDTGQYIRLCSNWSVVAPLSALLPTWGLRRASWPAASRLSNSNSKENRKKERKKYSRGGEWTGGNWAADFNHRPVTEETIVPACILKRKERRPKLSGQVGKGQPSWAPRKLGRILCRYAALWNKLSLTPPFVEPVLDPVVSGPTKRLWWGKEPISRNTHINSAYLFK